MTTRRSWLAQMAAGAALPSMSWAADAPYPVKPVTLVIGFSAGGPTDTVGRILAEQLGTRLKQRFVVENKAGANGGLAAQQIKAAAPDGYTLMLGSSGTLSIAPVLNDKLPYDPIKDFTTVGLVASYPYFLVVAAHSPITSVADLVKRAKAAPTSLAYASAGIGSVNHLAGEWFKAASGFDATHVPYKGDSAAVTDLIEGRISFAFISGVVASPQVKGGKLRALAVASATPGRGGPGVPTMVEAGVPDFAAEPWNGVMGPAGLPAAIVRTLNEAITDSMQQRDVQDRLLALEQYAFTSTPQGFSDHIARQTKRWAEVIRIAKIPKEQ